jgi:hypothetical protein
MPVAFGAAQSTTFVGSCSVQTRIAVHDALASQSARSFAQAPASAQVAHAPQLPVQLPAPGPEVGAGLPPPEPGPPVVSPPPPPKFGVVEHPTHEHAARNVATAKKTRQACMP